jgi:hypothetical protein
MSRALAFWPVTSALLSAAFAIAGCQIQTISNQEARQALEESSIDAQAAALTSASVEISTDFTIGQAVAETAAHIRDFVHSQLPCAEVTLADATLTIEYGAKPGACTFRGYTFAGTHTIHVEKNENTGVVVKHTWDGFDNGRISVSGEAEVTWDLKDPSRHIVHDLTWTRMSDGRKGTGSGDRTQRPLNGNLIDGIQVDGTREWEGERGHWELDIERVQMRWTDPAPQAGQLVLHTPDEQTVTLEFSRIDDNTIGVVADSGHRTLSFRIGKLGTVSSN